MSSLVPRPFPSFFQCFMKESWEWAWGRSRDCPLSPLNQPIPGISYSKLHLKEGTKHYMACRDTLSWGGSSGCSAIICLCRASKSQLSFIGIDFSHRQVYSYNSTAAVVSLGGACGFICTHAVPCSAPSPFAGVLPACIRSLLIMIKYNYIEH